MPDYVSCISDPARPGRIELLASPDDPRLERGEGFAMLRERGWPTLEWTLPVVDRARTMQALADALRGCRLGTNGYACDPMTARGEAIALTTLRPRPPAPGILDRLGVTTKGARRTRRRRRRIAAAVR